MSGTGGLLEAIGGLGIVAVAVIIFVGVRRERSRARYEAAVQKRILHDRVEQEIRRWVKAPRGQSKDE